MSETPKTDAFHDGWDSYNYPMEAIEFARQLERSNAEMLAALKRLCNAKRALDWSPTVEMMEAFANARAAIAKAKGEA